MEVKIANGWEHTQDPLVDPTLEEFWGEPNNPIEKIMRDNRMQ